MPALNNSDNPDSIDAIPKPCQPALLWMIAQLKPEALQAFLQSWQYLAEEVMRGFKLTPANTSKKVVRKRLAIQLHKNHELLISFLTAPDTPWERWSCILEMFDGAWLRRNWRNLLRGTRDRNLAPALATDVRMSIADRGFRLLARESLWKDELPLKAGAIPPECEQLSRYISPSPEKNPKASQDLKSHYDKAVARQQALESEVQKLQRALKKHKDRVAQESQRREKAEANQEQQTRQLRRKLKQANKDLQELREHFGQELKTRLQQYRHEALGITGRVKKIENELRTSETRDINQRTREVLDAHRRLNEKYAAVSQMRHEIAQLEEADENLERCAMESVQVLPQLHQLRRDIQTRLEELRNLLPGESTAPDIQAKVARMLKMIRNCTLANQGLKKLTQVEELLKHPVFAEIMGEKNMAMLRRSVAEKQSSLHNIRREKQLARIEIPEEPAPSQTVPNAREIWDIDRELERAKPDYKPVIYIDGYNVIKTTTSLNRLLDRNGLPAARAELTALCRRIGHRVEGIEIVYDGTNALSAREKHDNITETFAARLEESQNADNYITKSLHATEKTGNPLWLVTADGGLRARNRSTCDLFIDPRDLIDYLESQ